MKASKTNLLIMTLVSLLFISGYAFLRYAYRVTDSLPFTQEIILIILGTLVTVLITALLLNKQTEVELKKEQSIKFIELKSEVYKQLIDHIENILVKAKIEKEDLIRLQFITHRLAIVSSPDVLFEFENFLDSLDQSLGDETIDRRDSHSISQALARLSINIRADLIGELDEQQTRYSSSEIGQQILENISEAMDN